MDTHGGRPAQLLARLSVAPALLFVAWLAVGLPLLFAGVFQPGPVIALFFPVATTVLWLGLRGVGGRSDPMSWWTAGGVIAVAAVFGASQFAMASEQIIVRRDPASYVQFATWLTDHGSLPIPELRWAFGGADPALTYGSPAFYERGGVIIPQFMAGLPIVLAGGGWLGGTAGILAMAPVLGACAILSFGGLTARLIGPRWAPIGALALALTLPVMFVSRSTYSEILALVLLLGGISMMHDVRMDSGRGPMGPIRIRAALAGLALGLIVLVRIDGVRDILPVVVFAGLLVARRRGSGLPLFAGVAAGAGAGLAEGLVLSWPYLAYLRSSLDPLLLMATSIVMMTVIMVTLLWWPPTGVPLRRLGVRIGRSRLPDAAALLTVLVVIAFAVRPYFQTAMRAPVSNDDRINVAFIKTLQTINKLPIQPNRTYDEISLYWVVWYIGVPALLLATFGAALLTRRLMRRYSPEWVLPYMMIVWTTATTLLRPGITPDHPWASRRLVSVVIPGLILFALWALAWIERRVRRLGYSRQVTAVVAACGAIVLIVPIVATSAGPMVKRTEQGEVATVRGLCREIGPGASVVVAERVTADRFTQVIRGMCGLPAARTPRGDQAAVRRVTAKIVAVGRQPVVLGANASDVAPYGPARHVVHIVTRQDEHSLVTPPNGTWGLTINVWMAKSGG
jgi:hypothetical protein